MATVSSASDRLVLERRMSPNRRLMSEKVHSTFQRLPYPTSFFHWSLPTSSILVIAFALGMHPWALMPRCPVGLCASSCGLFMFTATSVPRDEYSDQRVFLSYAASASILQIRRPADSRLNVVV